MASTTEGIIEDVLFAQVSAATVLDVAFPNVDFKPTSGETYVDVKHLPNGFAYEPLNTGEVHQGILQVTVNAPEGKGTINSSDVAGGFVSHFSKGTKFTSGGVTVKISKKSSVGQPLNEPPYSKTPVTIQYIAS